MLNDKALLMETIGLVAAFCTTSAFLPQVLHLYRERKTEGISLVMYLIFSTGVLLWFIYGMLIESIAIMLANAVTFFFSIGVILMKLKWGSSEPNRKS